ncbi:MAG: hypothetical protein LBU65_17650 [Planctomycetaceae bacterium]|jgi:ATP-dependent DNA helicase RecG|nr:hypothetical protein [Planctomycetaceae bacterium]
MKDQIVEIIETWHDKYLKLICGFANTQGGELHIARCSGDNIVGMSKVRELLEMLPLVIRKTMGIVADVYLSNGNKFIVVKVNANPYPISYHGKYYLYSDGTAQELTGNALDEFMLYAQGKMWDSVPVPQVYAADLDADAFSVFRSKALASERLTEQDLNVTNEQLLETLKLKEGGYLKRAAVLIFHKEPEEWIRGAYVKIGFFMSDDDLVCQDEVRGSLLTITDKVLQILFDKYYLAAVSGDGTDVIKKYPIAKEALREAILNAVIHKDYASGVPVQIKVYNDKTIVFNTCNVPSRWMVRRLIVPHGSRQTNPLIASTFYSSGITDAWGTGIEKIIKESQKLEKPIPAFDPAVSDFMTIFFNDFYYSGDSITPDVSEGDELKRKPLIRVPKKPKKIRIPKVTRETKTRFHFDEKLPSMVIELMRRKPTITIRKIADKLLTTTGMVVTAIKILKEAGRLERDELKNRRNGKWIVKSRRKEREKPEQ